MSNKIEENLKNFTHPEVKAIQAVDKVIDKVIEEDMDQIEYIDRITSYHFTDGEIWLGTECTNENGKIINKILVFNPYEVLHSKICDKDEIKESTKKYIDSL